MESTFQPVSEQSHLRGKPAALATIDRRPLPPEHVCSNVAHKEAAAEIRRPKAETRRKPEFRNPKSEVRNLLGQNRRQQNAHRNKEVTVYIIVP